MSRFLKTILAASLAAFASQAMAQTPTDVINPRQDGNIRFLVNDGGVLTEVMRVDGANSILRFPQASNTITTTTADAADTARLDISGGGGLGTTRGATIRLFGNEHGTFPGLMSLDTGRSASGNALEIACGPSGVLCASMRADSGTTWGIPASTAAGWHIFNMDSDSGNASNLIANTGHRAGFATMGSSGHVGLILSTASTSQGNWVESAGVDGNTNGDMVFDVLENDSTAFATTTNKGWRWTHNASEVMSLTRGGAIVIGPSGSTLTQTVNGVALNVAATSTNSAELNLSPASTGAGSNPKVWRIWSTASAQTGTAALGSLAFYNQTDSLYAGGSARDGTWNFGVLGTSTAHSFSNGTGETLVLNKTGNTPSLKWEGGSGDWTIDLNAGDIRFYNNGAQVNAISNQAGAWTFGNTATTGSHLIQAGNTATTSAALIIKNTAASDSAAFALRISKFANDTSGSQVFVRFRINNDATDHGGIQSNGSTGPIFFSGSDRRIKKDIVDLDDGLAKVMALRPRKFHMRTDADGSPLHVGFIAQEFNEVFPEHVNKPDDGTGDSTDQEHTWSMNDAALPSNLVSAIQSLKADLDATKADYAAYKAAHP